MRASLKNYMAACNRRKEETGESGFSLIELIVVVVILGILAAIAVPVFTGLQEKAEQESQNTVAANAATQVASNISLGNDLSAGIAKISKGYTISATEGGTKIDDFCVKVSGKAKTDSFSGPGCP